MMHQSLKPAQAGFSPSDQIAEMSISPGIHWGDVQYSNTVRGFKVITNGSFSHFREGDLQAFDLANFIGLPACVKADVTLLADKHGSVILYEFRHYEPKAGETGPGEKVLHGYIIADSNNNLIDAFALDNQNSMNLIEKIIPYVTNRTQEAGHEFKPTILS